jgi:hypothetical protein
VFVKPRETFMTALAVPAVIAGGLGTASGVSSINTIKNDAERLKQEVRQERGIAKSGSFTSFQSLEGMPPPAPAKRSSLMPALIAEAHAQAGGVQPVADNDAPRFGIQVQQPRYVVVLKEARSQEEAIREAQNFRQQLPAAQAVKANNGYFVILGDGTRSETDALLAAARAKKTVGNENLRPVLVEIK